MTAARALMPPAVAALSDELTALKAGDPLAFDGAVFAPDGLLDRLHTALAVLRGEVRP